MNAIERAAFERTLIDPAREATVDVGGKSYPVTRTWFGLHYVADLNRWVVGDLRMKAV